MATVRVTVEETEVENDSGRMIPGLKLTCSQCNHSVEVYGTHAQSARRGAMMLREECPEGGENYYKVEEP
jgi:hypothetical protein